jgi:tetratricopeptide (TPR) repeat protein
MSEPTSTVNTETLFDKSLENSGKKAGWRKAVLIGIVAAVLVITCMVVAPLLFLPPGTFDDDHFSERNLNRAIAESERRIKRDPNNAEAYQLRGTVYYLKNEFDLAIIDFSWVIEMLRLDDNISYTGRGLAYFAKNDFDRAIADFDRAIAINPNNDRSYIGRAKTHFAKNDNDAAMADFEQAIRINPNNKEIYSARGIIYFAQDDFNHAKEDFEAVLRIDPNDAQAKWYLERIRLVGGFKIEIF